MASQASQLIRATFVNDIHSLNIPLEQQRRAWEEAAAQTILPPDTTIETLIANGVPCERISRPNIDHDQVLLYVHGGGFNSGSCRTHRDLAARLSAAAGLAVLLVDYRLAPEQPFPAAVEDVAAVYRWLLAAGAAPARIAIGGDSSGGGLAISALLLLRDGGVPLPAAVVLLSAWLDLTMSGPTITSRAGLDPLISREGLLAAAQLYIGDNDPHAPLISPVYADLHHLPPMLLHVGDHELLLSDSTRLAERAQAAGVQAKVEVWPEMWHVWHAFAEKLPEGQAALEQLGLYLRSTLRSTLHSTLRSRLRR